MSYTYKLEVCFFAFIVCDNTCGCNFEPINLKCYVFFSQDVVRAAGPHVHVVRMTDADFKQYPSNVTPRRAEERMAVPDIVEIQFRRDNIYIYIYIYTRD